jgi:hypothetical protein
VKGKEVDDLDNDKGNQLDGYGNQLDGKRRRERKTKETVVIPIKNKVARK